MKTLLTLLVASTLLASCATRSEPKPAVCDGKHRRPANPYGTVLPSAPDSKAPGQAASTTLGPQSSIDPKSFGPCGYRA